MTVRLNRYLSEAGYCSRREADRLIEASRVKINGNTAEVGMQAEEGDCVCVDGSPVTLSGREDKVIYAFYKPVGIVSTLSGKENDNLHDYLVKLGISKRVYPVGRLDKESCGLMLLTDDGELTPGGHRCGDSRPSRWQEEKRGVLLRLQL